MTANVNRTERLEAIAKLAACVVLETPVRSAHSHQSYVRRSLIAEIDAALRAAGFDMDGARKRYREIVHSTRSSE